MEDKRIIKKYPNRRLYDTEESKYITLEDIKKLVINNKEFIVKDANPKKTLLGQFFCKLSPNKRTMGNRFSQHKPSHTLFDFMVILYNLLPVITYKKVLIFS